MNKADIARRGEGFVDADLIPPRKQWWNKHRTKALLAISLAVPFGYIFTKALLLGSGLELHFSTLDLVLAAFLPLYVPIALIAQRFVGNSKHYSARGWLLLEGIFILFGLTMAIIFAGRLFLGWDIE
jgi:hypothetical protein